MRGAGGSVVWDEVFSDSLPLLDSLSSTRIAPVSLSDGMPGTDAFTITSSIGLTLSDSNTANDSLSVNNTFALNLTDAITASDNITTSTVMAAAFIDLLSGNDNLITALLSTTALTDTATLVDSVALLSGAIWDETLSDGIIATDSATITLTSPVIGFADTFNVSDNMWLINIPSPTTSIYNPNFIKLPGYNRTVMLNKNKRSIIILPERS